MKIIIKINADFGSNHQSRVFRGAIGVMMLTLQKYSLIAHKKNKMTYTVEEEK